MEDLRTHRAKGRVAVVALATVVMLAAPLALLHSGAATQAATARTTSGPRSAALAIVPTSLGATEPLSSNTPVRGTAAERRAKWARHLALVRHAAAVHRAMLRHAAAVHRAEIAAAEAHAGATATATVRATTTTPAAPSIAFVASPTVPIEGDSAVGVATWYGWYPGQCASPFLPHGTLVTVTDLATGVTIHCLVTDTEAHNPGRVVDLSNWCFEELAPLSQGVITVRISW